ncbi:hypothetical protein [Granulicella sp. S190]|uniref:hypothetical protein n=1 Tax=Granulicella sp. S190 TaxID=1747226 RepID=UPI00131AF48B|nr:hypothetical protein [Granulicella sp. S190]
MKELTAAFQSEVFRPIATLVVPGFFAVSTCAVAVCQRFPTAQRLAEQHSGLATTTSLLVVLTVGLITEDWGARLERYLDDRLTQQAGYERHTEEWFDYLRIAFEREPVGHRYLRTLVLRLKFELGMAIASILFAFGGLYLRADYSWRIGAFVIGMFFVRVFYAEAQASTKALSDLRRELLKKDWNPTRLDEQGSGVLAS